MVVTQVQPLHRWAGRAVGLDLHRDFVQVAICEEGLTYNAGRVELTEEGLESLAASLEPTDRVVMEVSGGAWEVARRLEGQVNRVVVVNFFASWCEACQSEVADLEVLHREYHDRTPAVAVVGVAFDFQHEDESAAQPHLHPDGVVHYHGLPNALQLLLTFLQTRRAAYAVVAYTPEMAQAFGEIRAIPTTLVFNRLGVLSKQYVGPPSLATLKADVQKLLSQ